MRGFKLKHCNCIAFLEKLISKFIIEGNLIDIDINSMILSNHFEGILDDGKCFQTEKVHLQDTCFFNQFSFYLGNQ